ncbi:hypothetical protein [Bradyrhizobium sp. AS23.2]|nr:hypothetical protein [Bradyrhizobium sp. AS23.2]
MAQLNALSKSQAVIESTVTNEMSASMRKAAEEAASIGQAA